MQRFLPVVVLLAVSLSVWAEGLGAPFYKPSSRAPAVIDISTNDYGGSNLAPNARLVGEQAPDFDLPISGGGNFHLDKKAKGGPVVLIFYRGHW